MRLTSGIIKGLQTKEKKYSISDGNGLYMTVKPNDKRIWEIRYSFNGKSNKTTLGSYPLISLKDARIKSNDFRRQLFDGINPIQERKKRKESQSHKALQEEMRKVNTFEKISREFIASIEDEYTSRYISIKLSRLENHVFPYIGKKYIGDMSRIDIIKCLDRLKDDGKIETAERILSTINQVFKYSVTREIAPHNITYDIDKRYVIGKKEVKHFATITSPTRVGEFMRSVDNYHGNFIVQCALKLAIYSGQRPFNIRFATWDEFDMEKNEWQISPMKMKMKRPHFVPITNQIKSLLEALAPHSKNRSKYLFPSMTSNLRPISENTINQSLRRLSYSKDEIVGHGLRAMFSTLANENIFLHGHTSDVIERHLAHVETNKIRGAYNHAEYYTQRFELAQWYCDYLDELKSSNSISAQVG
jgi:integrase